MYYQITESGWIVQKTKMQVFTMLTDQAPEKNREQVKDVGVLSDVFGGEPISILEVEVSLWKYIKESNHIVACYIYF